MTRNFVWMIACFLLFTACGGEEEDFFFVGGDCDTPFENGDCDTPFEDGDEEPLPDGDTLEDGDDDVAPDGDEPDGDEDADEDGDTLEDGDEDGDSVDTEDDVEQVEEDGDGDEPDPCHSHGNIDPQDGSCICDSENMTEDCSACLDDLEGFGDYPDCDTPLVWTDPDTGLMWMSKPHPETISRQNLPLYFHPFDWAGYEDWRIPTLDELRSLIRGCPVTESGGACCPNGDYPDCLDQSCDGCVGGQGPNDGCYWRNEMEGPCSCYWTTFVWGIVPELPDYADGLVVCFEDGKIYHWSSDAWSFNLLCVRDTNSGSDGDLEESEPEEEGLYHVVESDPVDGDVELGEGCEDWETPELGEDEEAPQWHLTSLWRESEIVPCVDVDGDVEQPINTIGSNEGWALAAWSDGADVVLFGDEQGLWRYEESPTPTLRCDPTTPGTIYTLQGTGTGEDAIIWAGLTGQVARLENSEWTVETLPSPLTGPVLAIALDESGHLAAQTLEGVAIRQDEGWEAVTGCEVFGIAFPEGVAVEQHQAAATGLLWQDGKLYVGATGTLVEIDPEAHTCKALCMDTSIEDNEEDEVRFAVQGKASCGLWVTRLKRSLGSLYWIHDLFLVSDLQICSWNGSLRYLEGESLLPQSDYTWSKGLTGFGLADRWIYGSYEYGFDDTQCHTGLYWELGRFDHTLTAWPHSVGQSNQLEDLGRLNYQAMWVRSVKTSDICWLKPTPIRPTQLFVTGHVGYYSPGFSKVTFGE